VKNPGIRRPGRWKTQPATATEAERPVNRRQQPALSLVAEAFAPAKNRKIGKLALISASLAATAGRKILEKRFDGF
jgi:hypothetical protein